MAGGGPRPNAGRKRGSKDYSNKDKWGDDPEKQAVDKAIQTKARENIARAGEPKTNSKSEKREQTAHGGR